MFKYSPLALATTIGLVVTTTSSARAVTINGGFESGNFTGWQTIGNTTIENQQALLTSNGVPLSDLETFLGPLNLSLNSLGNGDVVRGTAIKQTFTALAGDVLTLDWNFLTNEREFGEASLNDFAFYTLSNSATELADTGYPNGTGSGFVASLPPFSNQTGLRSASIPIPSSGTYTLALGVVDVDFANVNSGLVVDNVAGCN